MRRQRYSKTKHDISQGLPLSRSKTRRQPEHNSGKIVIRASSTDSGVSLQALLAQKIGISRNKAKLLLDQRNVFVNGARVWMANHEIHAGDVIETPITPKDRASTPAWEVLNDAPLFLVINKPAGLKSTGSGSLEEILRREINEPKLFAVHRLDRDTTGCWLLARGAEAKKRFVDCFERREVRKFYHALVKGAFPYNERKITIRLDGLEALTYIKRLRVSKNASHLLIEIHTGRTHQIRRHLAGIGFPVLGEAHYAGGKKLNDLERAAPRQMLHASEIIFPHPDTGLPYRAAAPLPSDFRECMRWASL